MNNILESAIRRHHAIQFDRRQECSVCISSEQTEHFTTVPELRSRSVPSNYASHPLELLGVTYYKVVLGVCVFNRHSRVR